MDGKTLIEYLKKRLKAKSYTDLASLLGVKYAAILRWKKRRKSQITSRMMGGLISTARLSAFKESQRKTIRPIVEFFGINKELLKKSHVLFSFKDSNGTDHPYRSGLKDELEGAKGVYVFFDSRGQAIYVGKAIKQSLWREMNFAFNRKRESVQKIKRVKHPETRVQYKTSGEKSRQIIESAVPLHEIAYYFSAYEVEIGMIDELESLLIRSFANDLLNVQMGRFGQQRKKRKIKK
jgi:hypothetical protein